MMKKLLLFSFLVMAQMGMFAQSTAVSVTEPESGEMYAIYHHNTNFCLTFCWEDVDSLLADSVKLKAYDYLDTQKFYFESTGDGYYTIKSAANNYYLSRSDGTNKLLPSGTTGWDMMWQAAMPEDQTLVKFAIEGLIDEQFVQLKNESRYNVSTEKCYIGIDYGAAGDGDNGILFDDKTTSYGVKSYWIIKKIVAGLDEAALDNLLTSCGQTVDELGSTSEGYDDFLAFLDYVDETRLGFESQKEVDHMVDTLNFEYQKYRIANASESYPVDVTEYYFGTLGQGWKTDISTGNFMLTGNVTAGEYIGEYFEHWTDAPMTGRYLYRTATVPSGNYSLKAACMVSGGSASYLYAQNKQIPVTTADATGAYFDLGRFFVTDNTLEFGLRADTAVAQWFAISQIELIYYGYDDSGMVTAMRELIDEAEALKGEYMQTSLVDSLSAAIAAGNSAMISSDPVAMPAATAILNSAIAQAKASVAAYNSLLAKLDAANAVVVTDPSTDGAIAFLDAIDAALSVYDAQTAGIDEIDAAIAALALAIRAYELSDASVENPIDISSYLVNANMDSGNTGWTWTSVESQKTNTKTSEYTGFAGAYFLEEWVASSTSSVKTLGNWDIYQKLTGMPNGTYTFTAYCIATNQGYATPSDVTGVELYANDQVVAVATDNGVSKQFSVVFYNSSDTLRVGFRGINPTCNWWAWDEVKVVYSGTVDMTVEAERNVLAELIQAINDEVLTAEVIKGNGPLQMPEAAFDAMQAAIEAASTVYDSATTKEEIVAAEDALSAALAVFKTTKIQAPDWQTKYVLRHYQSNLVLDARGDNVEVYANDDYILVLNEFIEDDDNQTFVFRGAASTARPYNIMSSAGKYLMMKGSNTWTMDLRDSIGEASIDSAAFDIFWVKENCYLIQTQRAYLGTNAGEAALTVPLYGDKSNTLEETYWLIEPAGPASVKSVGNDKTMVFFEGGKLTVNATEPQEITLYDLSGRRLLRSTSQTPIDMSVMPKGIYLVKVGDGTVAKIMKK